MSDDGTVHVAAALMESWFPKGHADSTWLATEDGQQWMEISLADAKIAIGAYKDWMNNATK